ncbi:SAM-dependent methyltransferase [Streptomyces sp. NBC_01795]|uniref:class I SAM-dependent methyltransferase n=1 Tax=Streptomyces sp. NBC_01795 TaxID=2975943 RepID=UPI002DDB6FCC|nr:SAM-dependent methyltransferase [Streptomyces sp. NBC_01795]WSA92106.1 SAM-dependent methyltransferase [Streptomyces sp. NBC_01795]
MTPALVHHRHPAVRGAAEHAARTRDWAEIQERMLVPLYEAVYERMETGPGTRVLGLGCGSGLALLLAAGRGAAVHGVDVDGARLELAQERLLGGEVPVRDARLTRGSCLEALAEAPPPALVTAFDAPPGSEELLRLRESLGKGVPVVLAGWGPAERCAVAPALRVAERLAEPSDAPPGWCGRDHLEELAIRSGLRLDGSGRVACPFGYAGMESAVRGLLSTGLYDLAVRATDEEQVLKELTEALHPYLRADGTVWMPNLFRYVVART